MKSIKYSKPFLFVILMIIALSLAACNPGASNNQAATEIPLPTSTRTRLPSTTPEPTFTATFTITPTRTITPLPTALDDFTDAKVISHGPLKNWNYLITIELPQPVAGSYRMIIDTNKEYKCEIQPGYPNRLYCHGRQVRYNDEVEFYLIATDTGVTAFEDKIFVGYIFP
jgi:hypothetical protein